LGNKEKRKEYDELMEQVASGRYTGAGGGFDPFAFYSARGASPGGWTYTVHTSGDGDFSDFFNMFFSDDAFSNLFGGTARRARAQTRTANVPRPGADTEAEITVGLREAFEGTTTRVTLRDAEGERTVRFAIPAGIKPGERIKLAGQGGRGAAGGKRAICTCA
jgi:curved DNA-binding protein